MISAVIVGLWTMWYLGMRAGIIAAIATAAALLIAQFVPGASITAYALVIAWCAALYFVIPRINKSGGLGTKGGANHAPSMMAQAGSAWAWAKKFLQR
ncbi:MAG: hypothetical protein R3B48_30945 [Kofleriaceae bacterium]